MWKREYPLSNKANAFNAKLAPKFRGPLEVRRVVSPVIVDLRDKSGRWIRHIHIQDLKPSPADNRPEDESDEDDRTGEESDGDTDNNGEEDKADARETDADDSSDENNTEPEDSGDD